MKALNILKECIGKATDRKAEALRDVYDYFEQAHKEEMRLRIGVESYYRTMTEKILINNKLPTALTPELVNKFNSMFAQLIKSTSSNIRFFKFLQDIPDREGLLCMRTRDDDFRCEKLTKAVRNKKIETIIVEDNSYMILFQDKSRIRLEYDYNGFKDIIVT